MVQEIDNHVRRGLGDDELHQIVEVQRHVGILAVAGFFGFGKSLEAHEVLAIVNHERLFSAILDCTHNLAVIGGICHRKLFPEGERLSCHVDNADVVRLKVPQAGRFAAAGFP